MTQPSPAARRFRSRLRLRARLRRIGRDRAAWRSVMLDLFTLMVLVLVGVGVAWTFKDIGPGLLTVGLLLVLLTPVGTAIRILIRGR